MDWQLRMSTGIFLQLLKVRNAVVHKACFIKGVNFLACLVNGPYFYIVHSVDIEIIYETCENGCNTNRLHDQNRRFRNNCEIVAEPNSSGNNRVRVKFFSLIT